MHVLLINPATIDWIDQLTYKPKKIFPIGLAYIGTALENSGHSAEIFDMNIYEDPFSKLERRIQKKDYDIVGISLRNINFGAVEYTYPNILIDSFNRVVSLIKKVNDDVPIVVGGAGFSLMPEKIMERIPFIDYGIASESESVFLNLLENIRTPEIVKGIYYRNKEKIIFTGRDDSTENLDAIPRRDLGGFPKDLSVYQMGVQTKRGCHFRCIYCNKNVCGDKVGLRSVGSVINELHSLRYNYGVEEVCFVDSPFYPKTHVEKISDAMIKENVDIKWWAAEVRADWINKKSLEKMTKSGCYRLYFLPSSGSHKICEMLQIDINPFHTLKAFRACKQYDLNLLFPFFLNCPGENLKTVSETFMLIRKLYAEGLKNRGGVDFLFLKIFPDTRLNQIALEKGIITKDTDLLKAIYYNPPPLNLLIAPFVLISSLLLRSEHALNLSRSVKNFRKIHET